VYLNKMITDQSGPQLIIRLRRIKNCNPFAYTKKKHGGKTITIGKSPEVDRVRNF